MTNPLTEREKMVEVMCDGHHAAQITQYNEWFQGQFGEPDEDEYPTWAKTVEPYRKQARERMSAALDTLTAAGYAIVPREPSDGMADAGNRAFEWERGSYGRKHTRAIYHAMLSAAEKEMGE